MASSTLPFGRRLVRAFRPQSIICAVLMGLVSGAAATLVREWFRALQWVFTQATGTLPSAAAGLPSWRRVLTPVVGGLLAAFVLLMRKRRASTLHREPRPYIDYVEAVQQEGGRIPLLPNIWRTGSAAFSIATGAAVGREGSMIQFAAAAVSATQRRWAERWPGLEQLPAPVAVACGVAGGVATAYQAPIAATFFALEIALGAFRVEDAVPVSFAAVAGWALSRAFLHPGPLYAVQHTTITASLLGWMGLFAVTSGCLGPLYQALLRIFGRLQKVPHALAIAGMFVGVLSLVDVRVWGNGDEGLNAMLGLPTVFTGMPTGAHALVSVLLLRLLATSICVGAGTIGGVFTPTLFAGAAAGALLACGLHVGSTTALAIAGMAGLIAATTHAPWMSTFIAVELTGDWSLLLPLLAVSMIATVVARWLSPKALYGIATEHPNTSDHIPKPG